MIIIFVHAVGTLLMLDKRLEAAEFGSDYFHKDFAYILRPKGAVGQATLAELSQTLMIWSESRSTVRKHSRAARVSLC